MADLDSSDHHRHGNFPAPQTPQGDPHHHLSTLLKHLHEDSAGLASRLLYRFGSIARIVVASDAELRRASLEGETWAEALVGVRQLINHGMQERILRTRLGDDRSALFSYLLMTMRNLDEERLLAIFADAAGFVITEEVLAEGGRAKVLVTARKVLGRALKLDARRVLLAHNHPSGSAEPSATDIAHTRTLSRQASDLGLVIEDHLVVGARQVVSMKDRGLI